MTNLIVHSALVNRSKTESSKSRNKTRYIAQIVGAAGGGLLFILLGFGLEFVFSFFERTNKFLNYAGIVSLITGFLFFGLSAHFLDKIEEDRHRRRKSADGNSNEKNTIGG